MAVQSREKARLNGQHCPALWRMEVSLGGERGVSCVGSNWTWKLNSQFRWVLEVSVLTM